MTTKINFSYLQNKSGEFDLPGFTIKLTVINDNVARLSFINKQDKSEIQLPKEATLIDLENHFENLKPFENGFFIIWIGSYSLRIDGKEVMIFFK